MHSTEFTKLKKLRHCDVLKRIRRIKEDAPDSFKYRPYKVNNTMYPGYVMNAEGVELLNATYRDSRFAQDEEVVKEAVSKPEDYDIPTVVSKCGRLLSCIKIGNSTTLVYASSEEIMKDMVRDHFRRYKNE